jgi:hypothetical protein
MDNKQEINREVVRIEYFSAASEPSMSFKKSTVEFNMVCLKQFANIDYVQFIIYPMKKRLVIEPCESDKRDAVRWSGSNPEKRTPKMITCHEFYRRICELMQWSSSNRYKVFGKVSAGADVENIIIFDLTSAITYCLDNKGKFSHNPEYPREWGKGFGESVERHTDNPLIHRFAEDTELAICIPENRIAETETVNEQL